MNTQVQFALPSEPRAFSGRVALVTGSTSGIGLGIARALAGAGAAIVLNGFGDRAGIAAIERDIAQQFDVEASYSDADMSSPEATARMIDATVAEFGRLDVLVNNAGILHVGPVTELPVEKWDAILAIDLSSAFHTIRAALPAMRLRGFGRIINVASTVALVGAPFMSAYVTAKHGMLGLTKAVALECAGEAITVNAICPGNVATPLAERHIAAQIAARCVTRTEVIRDMLGEQPNRRFVTVEEIGAMAVFLASDAAASVTGAAMAIDGGWTAH